MKTPLAFIGPKPAPVKQVSSFRVTATWSAHSRISNRLTFRITDCYSAWIVHTSPDTSVVTI